jgi:hypothetical protein
MKTATIKLPGKGRVDDADEGRSPIADARQTNGDGEAIRGVPDGHLTRASPSPERTLKLSRLSARAALEKCDNRRQMAVEELILEASTNQELRDELVALGAKSAVDDEVSNRRHTAWSGPEKRGTLELISTNQPNDSARVRALAVGNLMTFSLPDGTFLRDAMRSEIQLAADSYFAREIDARVKSRWLNLIAKGLPGPNSKVRDHFTADALMALKQEALKNAAA